MSLWLTPQKSVLVRLERFAWYPHFLDNLEDMLQTSELPEYAIVRWKTYEDFLFPIETDDEESDREELEFIDHVAELIRQGNDVPPIVVRHQSPQDGIHRAWAAHKLGLKLAPTIDLMDIDGEFGG